MTARQRFRKLVPFLQLLPDLLRLHPHAFADGRQQLNVVVFRQRIRFKYGAQGGWMRVSAASVNGRNRPEVSITVEDRGMGIASADLRRIFEPFYRGKAAQDSQIHGTGLGLSLSRKLAHAMRGEILVESELGKGSRFTLTLPAADMPTMTVPASLGSGTEELKLARVNGIYPLYRGAPAGAQRVRKSYISI